MKTIAEFRKEYPQYDDVSDQDLARTLHQKYYSDIDETEFNQQFLATPSAGESGIGAAFGAGVDQMQELGYRAVKAWTDVGNEAPEGREPGWVERGGDIAQWADEGIERNLREQEAYKPTVGSYKDIDSLSDIVSYVGEMTAQSIPMMATAMSPAGLFAMGGGLSNEAYEAQPEENKQPWRAVASGFGQAGLERLGVETAVGRLFGGAGESIARRVGNSALGEGLTETGQEALAQWGGGRALNELENLDEAFVGGAAVGGTIRTGAESGRAALERYRGETPAINNSEEIDLTEDATPDPFAHITPEADQAVNTDEITIIPGETAEDWQPNWQFGQNDMPYRGQMQPYTYEGDYEQYRDAPNSVPVGAALNPPVIDGEYNRPRALPDRSDVIIGEDGRPMQQAQEFADQVNEGAQRQLPDKDIVFAGDNRNVQVKRNGKPFGGRRAAELTKEFRSAREQGLNPTVVKINGGYGWIMEGGSNSAPSQTEAQPEATQAPLQTRAAVKKEKPRSNSSKVYTPGGRELDVEYAIVDADQLVTSNLDDGRVNQDYPQLLQPRDRTRASSEIQINSIANNINPALLGESATTGDGAPIVSDAGVVESGNGRSLAIRRAYQNGKAGNYRNALIEQGYDVSGVEKPVLVRVRRSQLSDEDLIAYTKESNERSTLSLSASELAQADAKAVNNIIADYNGGDVSAAANRDFVRKFMQGAVSQTEQASMIDSKGMLSQDGRRRIEAAMISAAYDDASLVNDLFESSDNEIKSIGGALLDASGAWAKMRSSSQAGATQDNVDITPNVVEAVNLVRRSRAEGKKLSELVSQTDIFAGDIDPVTKMVIGLFYGGDNYTKPRSRQRVSQAIAKYAELAGNTQGGDSLFGGDLEAVSPDQLLTKANEANEQTERQEAGQGGLFNQSVEPARPSGEGDRGTGQRQAVTGNEQASAQPQSQTEVITAAANEAATSPTNDLPEPTPAQKEAGNYKKGKVKLHGFDISIENPKGSTRTGTDPDGKEWSSKMKHHYGDIKGTTGADGDSIDVFIGDNPDSQKVFVVDQVDPGNGNFDEVKVMMGFDDIEAARKGYLSNYDKNWKGLGEITETTVEEFKAWTQRPRKSKQPYAMPVKNNQKSGRKEQVVNQIDDFGEKLLGARKHVWAGFSDTVKEQMDVSAVPLSQSFPDPDYVKMANDGADKKALGLIAMLKDSIPNKPRTKYKMPRWTDTVNKARKIASQLTDGTLSLDDAKRQVRAMGGRFNGVSETVDAFEGVNPDVIKKASKRWRIDSGSFSMFRGEKYDPPKVKYFIRRDGKDLYDLSFDTEAEATEFLKTQLAKENGQPEKRKTKISVYQDRYDKTYFLGWKGANGVLRIAEYDNIVDARAALRDNRDEIELKLAKMKETPDMRRPENRKRVGPARFDGNVTPELFAEEFGFRGVQFGNYVENKRRQQDLNQAYDGLIDLAEVLGIPPRALSLNGKLGIAFGARGRGGNGMVPAAHYEPGSMVINLTKKSGSGSLAHEWFHALDNYFATGATGKESYMTQENRYRRIEGIRPEMREAFINVMNAIEGTALPSRSGELDKRHSKRYWDTKVEMSARSFERYVIDRLDDSNQSNDYLANIVSEQGWNATDEGSYPYPTESEAKIINKAFDRFFRTIKSKNTDDGNVALFALNSGVVSSGAGNMAVSRANANKVVSRFLDSWGDTNARGDVTVAQTYDELPQEIKDAAKEQGAEYQVKGVFHKGKVHVVLDQHTSPLDVETTLFHEVYGHQGIAKLFGKDITQKLNALFVANGGLKGLRDTAKRHGINLGGYIDGLDGTALPQDIKNRILMDELLAHMQQDNKPSVKRLAREIIGMVRAGLRKLGLPGMASMTDSDLFFILRQARNAAQRSRDNRGTRPMFRTAEDATGSFAMPEETWTDNAIRFIQDKFNRVKRAQSAARESGINISDAADVYGVESLYYGKVEEDFRELADKYLEPMAEKMARHNIKQEELDLFLYALHAPERNAHIHSMDEEMTAGSGMTDDEARAIIDSINRDPRRRQFNELANQVREMIDSRTEEMFNKGLIDEETFSGYQNNYQFYVPLKGQANDEGGKPKGTGMGFNIKGKESIAALGRQSRAESPLLHAYMDTQKAIIRGHKNEVGNALINLINEAPNPELWSVYTNEGPLERKKVADGTIQMVPMSKEKMSALASNPQSEWFATKRDGMEYYVKLGDPVLAMQMKNVGVDNGNRITRALGSVNRFLAMMATSANPEFLITNVARDVQTAMYNLAAESDVDDGRIKGVDIKKFTGKVLKDMPKSFAGIRRVLRDNRTDTEWAGHFDSFRKAGAKTGYFDMKDIEAQSKDLQELMKLQSKQGLIKHGKAALKFIDDYNSAVENAIRLSVFKNAMDAGVSQHQAAVLAKNLTVNFNRKGQAGTWLNSLYLFANAGIQGTANFARAIGTFKTVNGKKKLNLAQKAGITIAGISLAMSYLNRLIAGEDDDGESYWDKVPDYVKERNFVLMIPGSNEYVTFPMPYGYNIFANFGTAAESLLNGGEVSENAGFLVKAAMGSFVPIGMSEGSDALQTTIKSTAPQILKPFVDLDTNTNFFGSAIYNEANEKYGSKKSDAGSGFKGTNDFYKNAALGINELTGGSEYQSGAIDVHPESIRYMMEYLGGGLGRFVLNTAETTARATKGEFEPARTPFVRRFYNETNDFGDSNTFYDRLDELETLAAEFDSLRGREKLDFRKENKDKLRLVAAAQSTAKQLRAMRKRLDKYKERDDQERIEQVEQQMEKAIDRFNLKYNRLDG